MSRSTLDLLLVLAALLTAGGCGYCIGVLATLRSRRVAERDERHRLAIAERTTRASIDFALHSGITIEQAEAAILKAMQSTP